MCRSYIQHAKCSSFTAKIPQIRWNFSSLLSTNFRQTVTLVGASGYSPTQGSLYPCCPHSGTRRRDCMHFIVPTFLTSTFFEDPRKFCDREHHGFLCVPWLLRLRPTPTPIDVIYRAKYDAFTDRVLKAFTGKSMTLKHIETTVFWCVLDNIKYSTNTKQYG